MKLASSIMLAPGDSIQEKLANLERYGFEGVEIRILADDATPQRIVEWQKALGHTRLGVSSVIIPGPAYALGFDSEASKNMKLAAAKQALEIGAQLGGGVMITPAYQPQPLPLFHPPRRLTPGEQALFYRFLEELAEHAEKCSAIAMLEPINRYETHVYHSMDDVKTVLDHIGSRRLRMVIDFFHMNIEEADIPAGIEAAADYIYHVQLGDNNRKLPGKGCLDFRPGFAALRRIGYDRYMALECQIPEDPERELPACVNYLSRCLQDSRRT